MKIVGTRKWFDAVQDPDGCRKCDRGTAGSCTHGLCELEGIGYWKLRNKEER